MQKVFGGYFWFLLVVLFLFLCVFVLLFGTKAQIGYFPAVLEVYFFYFVPPKGLSLKSFFPSYSVVFFLVFLLSSLSNFHFLCFLSSTPFGFFFLIFLSFFSFSFVNVCLFL